MFIQQNKRVPFHRTTLSVIFFFFLLAKHMPRNAAVSKDDFNNKENKSFYVKEKYYNVQ